MNSYAIKRRLAVSDYRLDLHAIQLDVVAAISRAFDEADSRLLLIENAEAARSQKRAA